MRISFVFLAGLLVFSHSFAADNLIRLSQPLKLDVPVKDGATSDSGKEVIKTEIPPTPSAAESAAAAAKNALTPAQKAANARLEAKDLQAQQEIGEQIRAKLEALRAKNAGKKIPPKPIPYVNRNSIRPMSRASGKPAVKAPDAVVHAKHWAYEGNTGPEKWGKLNPDWAQCDSGKRQSPIDIRDGIKVDLERIQFDYKPANFKVTDNGHTIQVDLEPGNRIVLTGKAYELLQFHFHRPSEERINGKAFPMVVHLVHKSDDNKLAVVALLVDEGTQNNIIQQVWNNLPLEKKDPVAPLTLLDMGQLLPMAREYYTYMGSLTTPPCSEGVLWLVMKQPIKLSAAQIAIFARLYPMNARPIQTNDGRMIKESN